MRANTAVFSSGDTLAHVGHFTSLSFSSLAFTSSGWTSVTFVVARSYSNRSVRLFGSGAGAPVGGPPPRCPSVCVVVVVSFFSSTAFSFNPGIFVSFGTESSNCSTVSFLISFMFSSGRCALSNGTRTMFVSWAAM